MSIFRTYELNCPACNTPVRFDLVMSVSADRRPDLREAILDGSFQRKVCPACATAFRPEPEFTYIDFARGQYIFVYPVDEADGDGRSGRRRPRRSSTDAGQERDQGGDARSARRSIRGSSSAGRR